MSYSGATALNSCFEFSVTSPLGFSSGQSELPYAHRKQLRIQGGSQGGHGPPLSLLKLVIKKMAAISGPLYFMFLAPPPPLTMLDPMLVKANIMYIHLLSYTWWPLWQPAGCQHSSRCTITSRGKVTGTIKAMTWALVSKRATDWASWLRCNTYLSLTWGLKNRKHNVQLFGVRPNFLQNNCRRPGKLLVLPKPRIGPRHVSQYKIWSCCSRHATHLYREQREQTTSFELLTELAGVPMETRWTVTGKGVSKVNTGAAVCACARITVTSDCTWKLNKWIDTFYQIKHELFFLAICFSEVLFQAKAAPRPTPTAL